MSYTWLKNHLGFTLTDDEFKDIPYPTVELAVHVAIKDIQAFGLIGTFIVGPIRALMKAETRTWTMIRRRSTRAGLVGVALGCIAGPAMTYGRVRNLEQDAIYDRCYRLRHNRTQVKVDRASFVGLIAGGGLGIALGGCPMYGGLVGMSAGVLTMAAYNRSAEAPKALTK